MKRLLSLLCAMAFAHVALASVSGSFIANLSENERRAAGIDQLTEQQRAALNVLANRWVEQQAESVIRAEVSRAVAEARALLAAEKRASADLHAATEPIRTRLVGDFRGWGTGTVFALENGQAWEIDGPVVAREFSPRRSPAVELRADEAGVWHLHLTSENAAVRVRRVR